MLLRTKMVAALAAGLITSTSAFAGAVVPIDNPISCDEAICTSFIPTASIFGTDLNLFGNNYSVVQVERMGNIYLYHPDDLDRSAILSPFTSYATYGTTTYGKIDYDGNSAFAVTWNYSPNSHDADSTTDALYNSFQLILVDRGAGDFDFIFNYDSIQWENAANYYGYGYGSGMMYFPDSGSFFGDITDFDKPPNSSQLPYHSWNSSVAGRYVFEVRNGVVINPLPAIPEPETWAMLLAGFGVVTGVARRRAKMTG